ncbi:MAG: WYL domain-containing protein [Actinobacteria bacterium]|uniref:Unannotated protein n=1 Tax=freshwater metagenome TaxID=449393 RepID=A0A6J7EBR7_9ZZZZ|nr:WYL domain-containing protein [Actinomycetota bacterium]
MTAATSRVERTERLLNLVLCLMSSRRAISRAEIHASVPGYGAMASGAAFERMFERDKDELRGMGIPIETVHDAHGDIEGYRISADQYGLPPLDFTSAELAVIALAASVWDEAILGPATNTALRKIEAVQGAPVRATDDILVRVQVSAADVALLPLMAALRERRVVTFDYRTAAGQESARRKVDPWGVISREGRWYLVAHDHDRSATRVFRVSRIVGAVTVTAQAQEHPVDPAIDIRDLVLKAEPETAVRAQVWVRAGSGAHLRRMADDSLPPFESGDVTVTAPNAMNLIASICAAGDAAIVKSPIDVQGEVLDRLRAVAARHGGHG